MNAQEQLRELFSMLDEALASGDRGRLCAVLVGRDFHDVAKAVNRLRAGQREVFECLSPEDQAQVVLRLNKRTRAAVLPGLTDEAVAAFLRFNDADDAADILQALPQERHESILPKTKNDKREEIDRLFHFGPETAGGLMDLNFIIVKPNFTFKDVAEKVQKHVEKEGSVPLVLVTDERGKLVGQLTYKTLIVNPPSASVTKLVRPLPTVALGTDQEEVMRLAAGEMTDVIGVTDENGRVLGAVHARDLLRIAEREATEDVYRFAGVHRDEEIGDPSLFKVRRRWLWLVINLATAVLASYVVSLFEGTISRVSLLAVFMPMVAGEGGNAATQALAVVVRGLAAGEVARAEAFRVIARESLAGTLNGVIIGAVAAFAAFLFHAPVMLALVLGTAMIVNLFVAGLFGATVPFVLKRLKIDPAIASSIFVTTATDVFGFLVFLGLGTWLLL